MSGPWKLADDLLVKASKRARRDAWILFAIGFVAGLIIGSALL